MNFEHIILERKEGVATLILNRPEKLNAINRKMTEELESAMVEIGKNRDVRVLVITGAGRGFCSGADRLCRSTPIYTLNILLTRYGFNSPRRPI